MPLKRCTSGGKSGWKWGDSGKCYTGKDAKQKALAQATAMGEFSKMDREELKKEMTDEEWLELELRRVDVGVTESLNYAQNIKDQLNELGGPVPDVPILAFLKGLPVILEEEEAEYTPPGRGPRYPEVAFVGASMSQVDRIRKRHLSGMVGKTFQELYLEPLGLSVDEVYITTLVKDVVLDPITGKPTDPSPEIIKSHWPDFVEEMDHIQPRFIVALGKTAANWIRHVWDEAVPHPRAIRMLGDSGEVGRKMKRLSKKVAKPDEIISGGIIKSVDEKQIVYGVVMEPLENDTDENWTTPEEITTAAHYFMKNFRLIDTEHNRVDIDAIPVESWVQHEDTIINGEPVKAGSWVMGVKVENYDEWERVKSGDYTGFSIDAFARIAPDLVLAE